MKFFLTLIFLIIQHCFLLAQSNDTLQYSHEIHLKNVHQLTFGGQNAEAYISFDESKLIFQSERDSFLCDQIFSMDISGHNTTLLSTGKGKTTCSYFLPGDSTFIFSSTHAATSECPPKPDYSKGYVWPIVKSFDIFVGETNGHQFQQLTNTEGYDAEATVSPTGERIVFTSVRNGDLDLFSMNLDGSDVRQLTQETGYDGGAFFSIDGKQIVYRAHHPSDSTEISEYQQLLNNGFVRPVKMEIFTMNADGANKKQLTHLEAASFAPFFHPNGKQIIFSSNTINPKGRNFELYLIGTDGSGLEQVTFNESFDGFPIFTRDGKKIVFASNRNGKVRGETNIFIADWIP